MEERRLKADLEHDELVKLVPKTEPQRTIFKMLMIGLLADKEKAQAAYRLKWKKEHYVKKPRPVKVPKPPKEKRIPLTKEELTARKMAYKKVYEKRILEEARLNPSRLTEIRKKRRDAGRRWLEKMKTETPEKYAEYVKRQSAKEKAYRWSNPQRHMACILRLQVYAAIKGQYGAKKLAQTKELLGCSVDRFMDHIESLFEPGMSWDNFGRGLDKWSVDHIRPCASFDLCNDEQQRQAFHYTNMRPMWFTENCSKNSHWNGKHWSHADHTCSPAPVP